MIKQTSLYIPNHLTFLLLLGYVFVWGFQIVSNLQNIFQCIYQKEYVCKCTCAAKAHVVQGSAVHKRPGADAPGRALLTETTSSNRTAALDVRPLSFGVICYTTIGDHHRPQHPFPCPCQRLTWRQTLLFHCWMGSGTAENLSRTIWLASRSWTISRYIQPLSCRAPHLWEEEGLKGWICHPFSLGVCLSHLNDLPMYANPKMALGLAPASPGSVAPLQTEESEAVLTKFPRWSPAHPF